MLLEVSSSVLTRIEEEAASARPQECCGILLGEGARLVKALPTTNVHALPETHFEVDPQALIDAHRAARDGGLQVVGYYHSHPSGSASPSATDRAMAAHDGAVWAIFAGGGSRFWRDLESGFEEVDYRIV